MFCLDRTGVTGVTDVPEVPALTPTDREEARMPATTLRPLILPCAVALAMALSVPALAAHPGAPPRPDGTGAGPLAFTEPLQVEAHAPIGSLLGNGERMPSGEPSIKVDSNGIIYIAGVTSVAQASPLWVSLNGGRSFEELTTPLNWRERSPYGAEGDIAIDAEDRMYFVDTAIPTLAFSRWSPPEEPGDKPSWDFTFPHTAGVLPGFDDRPWLAYGASPDGTESLWLYVNHVSHVAVYRSTDQGTTWEESTSTFPGQRFFTGMIAAPRHSSADAYLFGNCGDDVSLCSRATHDGGATWNEVVAAAVDEGREIGPIMVADAVDAAGTVYGVWSEADADDGRAGDTEADDACDVFYAASVDGGLTWLPKVRVTDGTGCAAFPWITAGDAGRIAIAWYETSVRGPHPDQVPKDAAWFLKAAVVVSATDRPRIMSGVADPNPVHVGPLVRDLWDYLQIAVGPDGRFHIAYAEDVTAGPDGPAGIGLRPSNGTNSKDTMYVAQAGGPLLIEGRRPRTRAEG